MTNIEILEDLLAEAIASYFQRPTEANAASVEHLELELDYAYLAEEF